MPHPGPPALRTLFRLLTVAGLATLSASCGSPIVSAGNSQTTTTVIAGQTTLPTTTGPAEAACGVVANTEVVVTDSNGPCRVSTHVGVIIAVGLDPGFDWDAPHSDSSAVEVTAVVRQPSGGLHANLVAARVGQATVSASGAVLCQPEQPCPALARLWQLHVSVGP